MMKSDKFLFRQLHNDRGITIIEAVMVLAILLIILVPLFNYLLNTVYLHKKADTYDIRESEVRTIMYEITDGFRANSIKYGGLRASTNANNISSDADIKYVLKGANEKYVLYFLENQQIYRYVSTSDILEIPPTGDATPVLANVSEFKTEINGKLVTIDLTAKVEGTSDLTLHTKVFMRGN
jgi:competence protein ComGC